MDRWKAEQGRGREKRKIRRSEKRKSQKKEAADARKGRKVAKHCVFPMIKGSGGSKSRLAKAAGAEPAGEMRDEKSARRCGAKHISKSKCTKHCSLGTLLEVEMSEKCTPLWREAHFEVKMYKTPGVRTLLEVQMSLRVAGTRDCAPGQKWGIREGFVAFSTTTTTTPRYTPIHYT